MSSMWDSDTNKDIKYGCGILCAQKFEFVIEIRVYRGVLGRLDRGINSSFFKGETRYSCKLKIITLLVRLA